MAIGSTAPGREQVQPAAPFDRWDEHLVIDLPGARALFTTRRGGCSRGPFATLNLGRLTADDPRAVARNRALVQSRIGGRLAMIRQVHGSRVLCLEDPQQASGPAPHGDLEEADGQATGRSGIAPIVLTADCLPIALAAGGAVAMLHAGWRGLAEGIVERGVSAVRALGAEQDPVAAIGPGAGGCCYAVGEEVLERFDSYAGSRRGGNLDLKAIAREQLLAAGVRAVHDAGLCTICAPASLFFSHRRDHGVTGRQAGIAWLT